MARKRMKNVTPKRPDDNRIVISVDVTKVATGHKPHMGGAGKHGDKRLKRCRTRTAQRRQALADH